MRTLLALVVLTGLGAAAPAQAESWSANDRRGDVWATVIERDEPSADEDCDSPPTRRARRDARRDILRLAVDHTADTVTVTLTMREVGRRDRRTSYDVHLRSDRDAYELSLYWSRPSGDLEVFLSKEPDYPDPEDVEGCGFFVATTGLACEAATAVADPETDEVTVTVPRTCLRRPEWVRAGAQVFGSTGRPPGAGFTAFSDSWARHGARRQGFLPPFGPRVHAD